MSAEERIGGQRYTFDEQGYVTSVGGCGTGWPHMVGWRGISRESLKREAAAGRKVVVKEDNRVIDEIGKPENERQFVPGLTNDQIQVLRSVEPYPDLNVA